MEENWPFTLKANVTTRLDFYTASTTPVQLDDTFM